jgi:hypothetical protein
MKFLGLKELREKRPQLLQVSDLVPAGLPLRKRIVFYEVNGCPTNLFGFSAVKSRII